ncbi:MAG: hypothetical protein GXO64_02455, partial [Candidatus Micrarchaeota archaeon]|nr:hypothetical protein [Candidatus Micrarchaeota archaeon]
FNSLKDLSYGNAVQRIVDDYAQRGIRFFKTAVYGGNEGVVVRVAAPYAMSSVISL